VKMLCDFDLESLVDLTVRVYSWQEMHAILATQRMCACHYDRRYSDRFSDDAAVTWQAFIFHRDIREGLGRFGVYARGERPCGMVQFWPDDWVASPLSEHFWPYLFARAAKQCDSLSQAEWRLVEQRMEQRNKKEGQERKRGKSTWRQR